MKIAKVQVSNPKLVKFKQYKTATSIFQKPISKQKIFNLQGTKTFDYGLITISAFITLGSALRSI